MDRLKELWKVLMTPSDHADDPYVEASNQLSHIALGVAASLATCVLWFVFFNEMPYRLPTWLFIVFGYAIIIEFWFQGWNGRDSVMDTFFVQCGATMALGPVKELAIDGRFTIIQFDAKVLGIMMILSAVSLLAHILPRFWKD